MKPKIFLTSNTSNVIEGLSKDLQYLPYRCRVAFITTAAEVEASPHWIEPDRAALQQLGWDVADYTISGKTQEQLTNDLYLADVIYVAGGNVFYLLKKSQESGFAHVVREHVKSNHIYIGHSAGAIIAGPNIRPAFRSDMAKHADALEVFAGFNLVNFIVLSHWGSERLREVYFSERLARVYSEDHIFLPLTDFQYAKVSEQGLTIKDMKA